MENFFTPDQEKLIIAAIEQAEKNTSGEIRLHVESTCSGDAVGRAQKVFQKLGMHKTELKNGVLIYLATKSKTFAIIGDKGINEKVPDNFWNEIKDEMQNNFKHGKFTEGLVYAISESGNKLKQFFPFHKSDTNELSNDISFGE